MRYHDEVYHTGQVKNPYLTQCDRCGADVDMRWNYCPQCGGSGSFRKPKEGERSMKTFADRLKYAMNQAGMSQAALSEKSGCSKAAISQYLSGKNTPGVAKMETLATVLGIQPDFLIGFDDSDESTVPVKKITVKDAARCMGKSEQFVRIGLQRGLIPFGNAVPGVGNNWNYYISPAKFRDYVGPERFNEFFRLTA